MRGRGKDHSLWRLRRRVDAFRRRLLSLWDEHADAWESLLPALSREAGLRVWNPQRYGCELYARFAEEHLPPKPGALVAFGLNPGKYGMSQTGIPFTDVTRAARVGLALEPPGVAPRDLVPYLKSYRVERSSDSVYRLLDALWGDAREGWRAMWAVAPCGLLFLEQDGANVTPADARLARRADVRALRIRVVEEAIAAAKPKGALLLGQDVARVVGPAATALLGEENVLVTDHPVARGPGRRGPQWWAETVAAAVRARGWA